MTSYPRSDAANVYASKGPPPRPLRAPGRRGGDCANGTSSNRSCQMAYSPAVLAGYLSLRAVTIEHGTLEPKASWAINLAPAATVGNAYMIGIASRFAAMNGWSKDQIAAMRADMRGLNSYRYRADRLTWRSTAVATSTEASDACRICASRPRRGRLSLKPAGQNLCRRDHGDLVAHRKLPRTVIDHVPSVNHIIVNA